MIIYADEDYRMEAAGLEDDTSDLVLRAYCQHCHAMIHERRYPFPETTHLGPAMSITMDALADAIQDLAHVCLARRKGTPC